MANPIEVQKHLAGVDYPCSKQQLVEAARANGADDDLIDELNSLPDNEFSGPDQVEKALF